MARPVLRMAAAGVGAALLVAALGAAALAGFAAAVPLAVWGGVVLLGVAFERWRYKAAVPVAGPGFQPTAERFIDPVSGRPVRVFTDPRTGERRYVEG